MKLKTGQTQYHFTDAIFANLFIRAIILLSTIVGDISETILINAKNVVLLRYFFLNLKDNEFYLFDTLMYICLIFDVLIICPRFANRV